MDDTDPDITFDESGICNHVHYATARLERERFLGKEGERILHKHVERIKKQGTKKPYDCIIGVSGGVDSTYSAWRCKEMGLRPLAVHLDNGWNSDLAVTNIKRALSKLDIDLYTYVVDWEEMKDVQKSVILSSTANLEIITDHAINATLFRQAAKHGLRTIITGNNVATESMHLGKWHYDNRDAYFIKGLHKLYGTIKLKTYPLMTPARFLWYIFVRRISTFPILNYGEYNKKMAIELLKKELDWRPYANKHGESIYTRFFQEYYLPEKFGFDKRKLHLSSLIVARQMTREEALQELKKPLYKNVELDEEIEYVTKKLGFSRSEWNAVMTAKKKYYFDYNNAAWMLNYDNPIVQFVRELGKSERSIFRKTRRKIVEEKTEIKDTRLGLLPSKRD
jgi:N-acetyl sugar amidotransferase